MYDIVFAHHAKRDLRRLKKRGRASQEALEAVLDLLAKGKELPAQYRDHSLKGKLHGVRECHIEFDLLLEYECDEELHLITILGVGTHSDLFR